MRLAAALPLGVFVSRYGALAAPFRGKVKITGIKAMAIKNIAGNCLIRIDTDAGLAGYGEAGATGPTASASTCAIHPPAVTGPGGFEASRKALPRSRSESNGVGPK